MPAQDHPHHPADRLLQAIERVGAPVCVGLDPVLERLPSPLRPARDDDASAGGALRDFCAAALEALAGVVPCIKLQSACFERFGPEGMRAARALIDHAAQLGLQVILDAKRGDIGRSAEHYAAAAFAAPTDWVTVNSLFGPDGITPFLQPGRGAFALVRTSNPGGDRIQSLPLADGRTVAEAIASMVAEVGSESIGARGFSALGAVVGATKTRDAARLRQLMPQQVFLVPGYGAQGATTEDILPLFLAGGTGAIVSASRSIIETFDPDDARWTDAIAGAAASFADDIARAVGTR